MLWRMAKLSEYERKRDARTTPEPFGGRGKKGAAPIFVVQRHDARRLQERIDFCVDTAALSLPVGSIAVVR